MNGDAQTEADVQRIQQEKAKAEAAKAAKALAEVREVRCSWDHILAAVPSLHSGVMCIGC